MNEKQALTVISIIVAFICVDASALVILVPQSGQVVTLMITLTSLLMLGMWAWIRKMDGK